MAVIIPRWEWRTFGTSFGEAEGHFAALEPTGVQESDEVYLLAGETDNVKIRADLMDIKVLVEVGEDGLEQWRPVLKAEFPLGPADVARVFEALRRPLPPLARDGYTLEQFLAELAGEGTGMRAVDVHKRRVRYVVGGCTSEVSEVSADGRTTRTIAIESEDRDAVLAAVRSVGLEDYRNTSYVRGLAWLVAGGLPRYAVIDVGTNSVKFHVGERLPDGTWRTVVDRAELTRLGEGLDERGEISPEALERTAAAIEEMAAEARREGALAIAAAGTAGLRIAANREEVVEAIRRRSGVTVRVVSGEEESRLAFVAVKAGLPLPPDGSLAVFDTGGGSTQLTFGHGSVVDERWSVDVGAVRLTEAFGLAGAVGPDVIAAAATEIATGLSRLDGRPRPDALVGMGGAITNITAVMLGLAAYDPDVVQGSVLTRDEIDRQVELYRSGDAGQRRAIVGLQPKRADVILAGALVVRTVMDKLGRDALTVSDRGLRHGLLAERFGH